MYKCKLQFFCRLSINHLSCINHITVGLWSKFFSLIEWNPLCWSYSEVVWYSLDWLQVELLGVMHELANNASCIGNVNMCGVGSWYMSLAVSFWDASLSVAFYSIALASLWLRSIEMLDDLLLNFPIFLKRWQTCVC